MTWPAITPFLNTVGLIVLAAAIVFNNWRTGSKQVSSEVISNYNVLDIQQKEQIAEKDRQIVQSQKDIAEIKTAMGRMKEEFANELGKLQGQLTSKDKQIADLQSTILNRNPELEKLLTDIRNFMKEIRDSNTHQTQILEGQVTRDVAIDKATAEANI